MDVIRQAVDASDKMFLKTDGAGSISHTGKVRGRGKTAGRRNQVRTQIATIAPTPLQYKLEQTEDADGSSKTVAYRVVHVSEDLFSSGSYSDTSPLHSASATTVYANQLNSGGVCVLSSPHPIEVYPVSPDSVGQKNSEETSKTGSSRDDKRRATHNEVERRRRDKINHWIMKLSKVIPECKKESSKGTFESQSKGCILAKACEFITELKDVNKRLLISIKEHEQLMLEMDVMNRKIDDLTQENELLKATLVQNGLPLP